MRNANWMRYTWKHRRAVEYVVKKYVHDEIMREHMLKRAQVHDMDKILMYLFNDAKEAQLMHVSTQAHHLENNLPKSYEDLMETVLDYESAPYTKPDKPLNAYDFVLFLFEHGYLDEKLCEKLFLVMHDLGIDHSGTITGKEIEDYGSIYEPDEKEIVDEIMQYVRRCPKVTVMIRGNVQLRLMSDDLHDNCGFFSMQRDGKGICFEAYRDEIYHGSLMIPFGEPECIMITAADEEIRVLLENAAENCSCFL